MAVFDQALTSASDPLAKCPELIESNLLMQKISSDLSLGCGLWFSLSLTLKLISYVYFSLGLKREEERKKRITTLHVGPTTICHPRQRNHLSKLLDGQM